MVMRARALFLLGSSFFAFTACSGAGTGGDPSGGTASGGNASAGGGQSGGTTAGGNEATGGGPSGGTASGGNAPGGTSSTGGSLGSGGSETCEADNCPFPDGIDWECKTRFNLGINYAWNNFAADFGGISQWNQEGVSSDPNTFNSDLATMKAAGVEVIRWWMWPEFRTDSITWTDSNHLTGIEGSLIADVQKALELANDNDVYLQLTPFSFDNFRPTRMVEGVTVVGMHDIVADADKRDQLLENLIRPVAQAVASSPYASRVIAWDLINEPEWALTGANMYGGEDFEPDEELDPVTHAQMETFLNEMASVLRSESSAHITVGSAAIKWGSAWTNTNVDFYSLHYYDWVYRYFPYTTVTPASVGLVDKPVMMGEFPYDGLGPHSSPTSLPEITTLEFMEDLYELGYAGALGWDFTTAGAPSSITSIKDAHPCETSY